MNIPAYTLVLDVLGAGLMALGITALLEIHVLPPELRFPGYEVTLIVAGVLLTIPFLVAVFRLHLGRQM